MDHPAPAQRYAGDVGGVRGPSTAHSSLPTARDSECRSSGNRGERRRSCSTMPPGRRTACELRPRRVSLLAGREQNTSRATDQLKPCDPEGTDGASCRTAEGVRPSPRRAARDVGLPLRSTEARCAFRSERPTLVCGSAPPRVETKTLPSRFPPGDRSRSGCAWSDQLHPDVEVELSPSVLGGERRAAGQARGMSGPRATDPGSPSPGRAQRQPARRRP